MNTNYEPLTPAEKAAHQSHSESGNPAVYVGTYGKYASGSIFGQWVDLTTFADYAEFYEYLHRLHTDEYDPEFMFQDYENFPESLYREWGMNEETFNTIREIADMSESERGAYEAYLDKWSDGSLEDFQERYIGEFDSDSDCAAYIVDMYGGVENLDRNTIESFFDYDGYYRNLYTGGDVDDEGGYYFWSR